MPHMITSRTAADGSETWMELHSKFTLRALMEATRHRADGGPDCSSIPKLSKAAGTSPAAIGFLVSHGRSGRDTCSVATAEAICAALGCPTEALFRQRSIPRRTLPSRAEVVAEQETA